MKFKNLWGFFTLGLTIVVLGVAFLKPFNLTNFLTRASSGDIINSSITWNPSSSKVTHQGNRVSYTSYTSTGLGVVLYANGQYNVSDNFIFSSKKSEFQNYFIRINSETGSSASIFRFQSITSITIVTASTSQTSSGFEVYTDALATSSPVYTATISSGEQSFNISTEVAGAHYLTIKPSSTVYSVDIKSVTVSYSCDPGGGEYDVDLVSISISGQKTEFDVGDTFSFGGTVTAHYDDTTSANVTSSATFSGYDMSESGEQTVTVSYTENGITKTTTYKITVSSSDVVVLVGTYEYASRKKYSTPDWTQHNMTITFYSDGTCMWRNVRTNSLGNAFDCKVYFTYVATDNGSNITVAMAHTTYDFTKDGEYNNQASSFSGGSYDRPINGGFGSSTSRNDSIVMSSDRSTFTINTYDQSHSYEVYDTFTFSIES